MNWPAGLAAVLATAALPEPSGSLAVGTTVMYLTDSSRTDADFPHGRPVTLQAWYPAQGRVGKAAPYLFERGLSAALLKSEYYGLDSVTIGGWSSVRTNAYLDAAPAKGRFPLLFFSVGLGVIRANYSSFAAELASRGYVVAMVESPLQGFMVLPDGSVISDTAGRYGEAAAHRAGVGAWSGDISFALDRMMRGAGLRLSAHLDTTRIGALGHSTGGLVAVAACECDRRIRACANMDGGVATPDQQPLADFVPNGVTKPTLFLRSQPLYDDTTLARRGMTREQWEKRGEGGRLALEALATKSAGHLWLAQVAGTGHFSFSDAPFVMPTAITRFGGRIIDPRRGWTIIAAALKAFFDRELEGKGDGLAPVAREFPELTVKPASS